MPTSGYASAASASTSSFRSPQTTVASWISNRSSLPFARTAVPANKGEVQLHNDRGRQRYKTVEACVNDGFDLLLPFIRAAYRQADRVSRWVDRAGYHGFISGPARQSGATAVADPHEQDLSVRVLNAKALRGGEVVFLQGIHAGLNLWQRHCRGSPLHPSTHLSFVELVAAPGGLFGRVARLL